MCSRSEPVKAHFQPRTPGSVHSLFWRIITLNICHCYNLYNTVDYYIAFSSLKINETEEVLIWPVTNDINDF